MTDAAKPTLVFIHGAWHGQWAWDHFVEFFRDLGYPYYTYDLPGHDGSKQDENFKRLGIDDYVKDLEERTKEIKDPVLIGHSIGGMIIQRYLAKHTAKAAVLLAPVPFNGIPLSTIGKLILCHCMILINIIKFKKIEIETVELAREFFFSEDTPEEIVRETHRRLVPESPRTCWDISILGKFRFFCMPKLLEPDTPRLILYGDKDYFMTVCSMKILACRWGGTPQLLPGLSHNLPNEQNWRQAAEATQHWLDKQLS